MKDMVIKGGRGTLIGGIATRYRLDGPRFESWGCEAFRTHPVRSHPPAG
jgi:hypothetical protein